MRSRWALSILAGLLLALLTVLAGANVRSRADLSHLAFGGPLAFIIQDQTIETEPAPSRYWEMPPFEARNLSFRSEHPISVNFLAFMVDVAAWLVAFYVIRWMIREGFSQT